MPNLKERIKTLEEKTGIGETENALLISICHIPYPESLKNDDDCLSYKKQHSDFIEELKKEKKEWNCGVFELSCIGCVEKCTFAMPEGTSYGDAERMIEEKEAELNKVQTPSS
jgi:hypothetical protein